MLICDEEGFAFYSKDFDGVELEASLLSGLISAIGSVGRHLFNKEIATIHFGDEDSIVVISKDLIAAGRTINFVFLCSESYDIQDLRRVATRLFMGLKPHLKYKSSDVGPVYALADKLVATHFPDLGAA
ncbi:MAG: hypothetical protein ACTSU5_11590 [Promethearchaeota archaeon]